MDPRIRNHELPAPGNWDFVNIEMVVGLRPDLVIVWSHQQESILAIEEKGIPVYGVFIESLDDIHEEIIDLGRLTGSEKRAEELTDLAGRKVAAIRENVSRVQPESRPRVYYMWAQGELETSGKSSTVQELINLSGGKNVAGHIRQEHLVVNMENILTWDPEVVVMWYNARKDPEDIMRKAMWRSVSAVKHRRIHEFPDVFACDLWTLKYIHAVELLAKWCYPERFKDLIPSAEKWKLLQNLYGEKLNPLYFDKPLSNK
jgi:iron complex transport system substrate-binding protein